MPLNHHGPPVNSSEYLYLSRQCQNISQNIASNSHCFGHTDSRAGSPWNFKIVYTRVHRRKSGQSYHRPPANSSEFLVCLRMPRFGVRYQAFFPRVCHL